MKRVPRAKAKDYKDFERWVRYYLNRYGLNDWTVYFEHKELDAAVAQVNISAVSRGATFSLATNHYDKDTRATARHEVCHLLIADLSHLVGTYCSEEEHRKTDEALVCRLTNLLDEEKSKI